MGFKFSYVCDLFTSLETNLIPKAATASRNRNPDVATIVNWFSQHGKQIHGRETDRLALLSCLFPERRPERVYGLKEPSLVKVIGRCLLLGVSRRQSLDSYKICGNGDLGQCVERVMRQAENDISDDSGVTVEEIDAALNHIASRCRFSGPEMRRERTAVSVDEALGPILRRLTSRDAKWFTRLILKDLSPLTLPARLVLQNFHFLLPDLLLLQDSLAAAVDLLSRDPMKRFPWRPDPNYAKLLASFASSHISLTVGVKVGRPMFYKARGIKHCCKMAGKRTMSVERKYDGEYCQIHIDLSKVSGCIQIFSKSGRDSTTDRRGIHSTMKECLRIGKSGCKISKNCILEGELLVWSDVESKLLPFHKLRKHVIRSGSFIGTENDSPPHPYEHLYMMLFDILLIDNQVCLPKSYRERRALLRETVHPVAGRVGIAEQEYINFSLPNSQEALKNSFATAISQRWEGLVLKGSEESYFTIAPQEKSNFGHWIKLKKDYIAGTGDTADFAVIGARYDAREAAKLGGIKGIKWTSFFVGCRDSSSKYPYDARPIFRVVDVLNRNNVNIQLIRTLNQSSQLCCCDVDDEEAPFAIICDQVQLPKVQVLFKSPFVVEMMGSGFEKPAGVNYFTLRFPRVLKIHSDRAVEDATTLEELQELAKEANSVPADELSQEAALWAEKLDAVDGKPGYIIDTSENSSMSVASTVSPTDDTTMRPLFMNEQNAAGKRKDIDIGRWGSGTVSKKRSKIVRSLSPCIAIHSDNTQTQTTADTGVSPSQDSSVNRRLADLTNLSQPNPAQTNTSTSDRGPIDVTAVLDNEKGCSRTLKERGEDELHYSPQLSQQKGPSQNPYQEQQCSHKLSVSLKGSNLSILPCDSFGSKSIPPPPEPLSYFSEIPILIGTGVSYDKVDHISPNTNQLLTPSMTDFLEKVLDPHFPNKFPAHSFNREQPPQFPNCRGIVLVKSYTVNAPQAASDIAQIGNALAANQHTSGLPLQKGKIIFLNYETLLQHGLFEINQTEQREKIREQWEKLGKRVFAGCLKWGHGMASCRRNRKRKRTKFNFNIADGGRGDREKSVTGSAMDNAASSSRTAGVDVQLNWNWREILSLV
ncbi:DNA ligase (ATP) [[Emmonsia] crescens]|uniref:DNA ligase (ATP) n=1 Tax=[Emmonsia] crescens TaxID=73230 RepID=A0A0G2HT41_9EURO|nr:DNA ligase (ATP) [Emmonsia crescens UAMH 3008]